MKKLVLFFMTILFFGFTQINAGQGSAGAQFLQIFGGTHASALSGAFTAYQGSVQSLFWNPAGIREVMHTSVNITHAEYFAGINYENVAIAIPVGNATIGIHAIGLLSGDIDETTVEEDEGTGDTFTANDYAAGISFARAMTNKFDAGVTLKLINQNLAKVSATGWAFDIGALYKTGLFANLRIGFSVRNFGPDLQYSGEGLEGLIERSDVVGAEEDVKYKLVSEQYSLPMSFHIGAVMDFKVSNSSKILLNFDATNSIDQKESIVTALEWQIPDFIYVAMGNANMGALFQSNVSDEDLGGNMRGFTFGGGINFGRFTGNPFWVEYSWEDHKYLKAIHRVGLELSF